MLIRAAGAGRDWQGVSTCFTARTRSLVTIALIALFCLLTVWIPYEPPPPRAKGNGVTTGDMVLYRDISKAMAAGENYYTVTARLQRERDYPLRPFITVRPPTLAWLHSVLGARTMLMLAFALTIVNALLWYRGLIAQAAIIRLGGMGLMAVLGSPPLSGIVTQSHEWWAGLLLSCALALNREGDFAPRVMFAVAAALIRELAAPFLIVILLHAVFTRRWRRAALLTAILTVLAALLAVHAMAVMAHTLPTDPASRGWLGLRGLQGFVNDVAGLLGVGHWPRPLTNALILLPLAGWAGRTAEGEWPAIAWFTAMILLIAIAARADNFYWAQMLLPGYLAGYPLLLASVFGARKGHSRLP